MIQSVLFVTPQMPSFRGSGLAMRAAATVKALSQFVRKVHLLVVPVRLEQQMPEPDPEIAAMIASWKMVEGATASGASVYWQERLRGAVPSELSGWNE